MKYFKTPERLDGKRLLLNAKKGQFIELVANELFTEKEVSKMGLNTAIFEPVDVSRRNIFYSFGLRFSL